jgi:CheY-like chemotaxis protein
MEKPIIPGPPSSVPQGSSGPANSLQTVSEALKRADQFIKKGDLEHAQGELSSAKKLAPKNIYILALEERISVLIAEADRKIQEQNNKNPLTPMKGNTIVAPPAPYPPLPLAPMEAMVAAISNQKQAINSTPQIGNSILTVSAKPQTINSDFTGEGDMERDCYREAVVNAWSGGAPNVDEKHQLRELRIILVISEETHRTIEKEIKQICFNKALSEYTSSGRTIAELQQAFQLSDEEFLNLYGQSKTKKEHKQHDTIMLVDDDTSFLSMLSEMISEEGFTVIAMPTSDEAYRSMQKQIPDIILCDINLKTSTMNGFTFCEKIQENKKLQQIPFIFLTGFKDERFTRIGKELGVDDYLEKPISKQELLSTIRGKLKRFRRLRNNP